MKINQETELLLRKFAHEIRNPLTTVYSTIQFIESQHPEVKDFKYWSSIAYDLEYINQLIDELSNYAKAEHLTLETFDLRTLLEKVSLSFAASIADSGVEYTSKIDPSISKFKGDKVKLQEVFVNLLKNAYEASKPDKTIRFTALCENSHLVFLIEDTGCGITEEQLPTIFQPFVTYKKDGTGLGLAICEQIVHAHNGRISVKSTVDCGTTFRIELPT